MVSRCCLCRHQSPNQLYLYENQHCNVPLIRTMDLVVILNTCKWSHNEVIVLVSFNVDYLNLEKEKAENMLTRKEK